MCVCVCVTFSIALSHALLMFYQFMVCIVCSFIHYLTRQRGSMPPHRIPS